MNFGFIVKNKNETIKKSLVQDSLETIMVIDRWLWIRGYNLNSLNLSFPAKGVRLTD